MLDGQLYRLYDVFIRMVEWLWTDPTSFNDSYVRVCLPKLASHFVRLQLCMIDPLRVSWCFLFEIETILEQTWLLYGFHIMEWTVRYVFTFVYIRNNNRVIWYWMRWNGIVMFSWSHLLMANRLTMKWLFPSFHLLFIK